MDRHIVAERLHLAATRAREFAQQFVIEDLPADIRFRLHLNSSYDGNPLVDDFLEGTEQQLLPMLFRDGRVPEWINFSVVEENGRATIIEVLACGRFTATEDRLYHAREGIPPFHVLGPALPFGYREGERFSLFWSATASTVTELSLDAVGDLAVSDLPPQLEKLKLRGKKLVGELRPPSTLRDLSLHVSEEDAGTLASIVASAPRALQSLSLAGSPIDAPTLIALLPRFSDLRYLDVTDTSIRDAEVMAIGAQFTSPRICPHFMNRPGVWR